MPTYEYRCETCGDFEETQRISDPPLQRCPKCRHKVRRLISNTSFQLKGSGWYVTDYARGSGNGSSKTDAKSDGKGEGSGSTNGGESKTESKADTKAETKPAPSSTTDKSSS